MRACATQALERSGVYEVEEMQKELDVLRLENKLFRMRLGEIPEDLDLILQGSHFLRDARRAKADAEEEVHRDLKKRDARQRERIDTLRQTLKEVNISARHFATGDSARRWGGGGQVGGLFHCPVSRSHSLAYRLSLPANSCRAEKQRAEAEESTLYGTRKGIP